MDWDGLTPEERLLADGAKWIWEEHRMRGVYIFALSLAPALKGV